MRKLTLVLTLLALPLFGQIPLPPAPERYVTDRANVIDDARELALNERLAQYDRQTSNQVIVYIDRHVPAGTTLEEMGAEAIRAWKVGQRKLDNGAILFLFIDDRESRIEVGYGLEGVLTDARSKRILVELRTPLRAGDYAGAAELGVERMLTTLSPVAQAPATLADRYVIDDGHFLDDLRVQRLNERLAAYERENTLRLLVRVEPGSYRNEPSEEPAVPGATLWIFAEDATARIDVSAGLRDRLTQSRVDNILTNLGQQLHGRSYTTVAERGVDAMIFAIAQPYAVPPPSRPVQHSVYRPAPSVVPTTVEVLLSLMLGFGLLAGVVAFFIIMIRGSGSTNLRFPTWQPRNPDQPPTQWPETHHTASSSGWTHSSPSHSSSSSSHSSPSTFHGGGGSGGGGGASDKW